MEENFKKIPQKSKYFAPSVEIYRLDDYKDVLCMSNEANDNEFDASGMGDF